MCFLESSIDCYLICDISQISSAVNFDVHKRFSDLCRSLQMNRNLSKLDWEGDRLYWNPSRSSVSPTRWDFLSEQPHDFTTHRRPGPRYELRYHGDALRSIICVEWPEIEDTVLTSARSEPYRSSSFSLSPVLMWPVIRPTRSDGKLGNILVPVQVRVTDRTYAQCRK